MKHRLFFTNLVVLLLGVLLLGACKKDDLQSPVAITGLTPASGPRTTVVTITGSSFSAVPSENVVTLNELVCPVSSATGTELKVSIPPKAGSGKIKVTVKGQSGQTPRFTYAYTQVTISSKPKNPLDPW
jgi:hypothetical protein